MSGDFCGYHGLGSKGISLCVACAEQEIDVWNINLAGEVSGGLIHLTIDDAIETMNVIMQEMANQDDEYDSYSINKQKISRLEFVTMPDFQGF